MDVDRPEAESLQRELVGFIRAFGLLSNEQTPCGQPMAPSDAHALSELAAGSQSQRDLTDRLGLDRSSVSRLVERLVHRGWIERAPDDTDRRKVRLALTSTGQRIAAQVGQARGERFAALLANIPADQRATVVDSIERLADAARRSRTDAQEDQA